MCMTFAGTFACKCANLWSQLPLANKSYQKWRNEPPSAGGEGDYWLGERRGPIRFIPLVSDRNHLLARLDILLLRPAPPRDLLNHEGDFSLEPP
jgi:hypothetical protein